MAGVYLTCNRTGPIVGYTVQVEVTPGIDAVRRIEGRAVASAGNKRLEVGSPRQQRSPVGAALEGPDAIELPPPQRRGYQSVSISEEWKFPHIVKR